MSSNDKQNPEQEQPSRSSTYPTSRLSPGFDLVDIAKEIQQADAMIHMTSHARLKLIAEQMLQLKQQARNILEEAQQNQQLHRAICSFKKIPGKTYHLYKKTNGELYFSMLSPAEWGHSHRDEFQGSYTLQGDQSWKPCSDRNDDILQIDSLLESL